MRARIYQPARNAMQSGQAKTHEWLLEFTREGARDLDPLMGWTGSADTQSQIRLCFDSLQAAEDYAREQGIDYVVLQNHQRNPNVRARGYGENFAFDRRAPWTH